MNQDIIRIDLQGVNCYLVKADEGFILFDTGGHLTMDKKYTSRQEELLVQLNQHGCKPGNLRAIILTHGDNDHSGNASYLRDKFQTIIAMHQDDIELVEKLTLDKMMESFHYQSILFKIVFFFMNKTIRKISAKTLEDYVSFHPDILLKENDSLLPYGIDAKILHLPGHTAGSIGILMHDGSFISGDTLANMKRPSSAPNAADFKKLKSSIKKIRSLDLTMIYPGHGEPFTAKEF
jgi:glyoxylase-like metal-dependent hydrolase (beta-lactamase superfamily II)